MNTECELHKAVCKYIRDRYEKCFFIPTLGENTYNKGHCRLLYTKGSPDIIITNNKPYFLCLELKSPKIRNPKLSPEKQGVKEILQSIGHKYVYSNFFQILQKAIYDYMTQDTIKCR